MDVTARPAAGSGASHAATERLLARHLRTELRGARPINVRIGVLERPAVPRLSLRVKLLVGVFLILAPVLGLFVYDFQMQYARQREAILGDLLQTAQTVAAVSDATFDEAVSVGWAIASQPAIQSRDPSVVQAHLRRLAVRYPQFDNIAVVNAQGFLVAESAPDTIPGRYLGDRPYFQRTMATGEPSTIEVVISRRTGRPATGVVVPLPGPDGGPIGVIRVSFDLAQLEARLAGAGLRPGQRIGLIDTAGRLALFTERPDLPWEERDVSAVPEVQAALAGETIQRADYRSVLTNDLRAAAFVPTPEYGWVVTATWASAQAFGPLEAAFHMQLLIFFLIALLAVLGVVLLGKYLVGPLERLAVQAQALGRGDLRRRVDIRTGDELERLGQTFNHMADQVQDALRLREEFLAAAVHELRTPATSLKGYAQLLEQGKLSAGLQRRALANIAQAADRVARLARELSEADAVARGTLRLNLEPLDLVGLVAARLQAAQAEAPRHRFLLCAAGPLVVRADRERLELTLDTLLEHAVKYQTEGGPIHVTVAEASGGAEVVVRDFGPGISPERLPYLFEPLFEPWPPGSPHYVGVVGLRLHLACRIIQAHGGRIEAESQVGRGATIRFRLPLAARGERT